MKITKRDVDDVYRLDFGSGTAPIFLSEEEMDELRAHLQAERDETLGRWRDPENPDMVVYPHDDVNTTVHDETTGAYLNWSREQAEDDEYSHGFGFATARAYFAAHPEPKPWDAAQPDEIWVLTDGDREEVFRCGEHGLYQLKTGNPLSRVFPILTVTGGRRIWPEGEASE